MDTQVQIRESALNMLSRREHSQFELRQKLSLRFKDSEVDIEDLLSQLIEENYQSDQRFCESFIRYRQQKGYAQARILSELRQKGLDPELITLCLNDAEVDWFELALKLKRSKFGEQVTQDYKVKSKQYRYLQYRGFSSDQINYAIHEELDE